jgi:hypothetical protein
MNCPKCGCSFVADSTNCFILPSNTSGVISLYPKTEPYDQVKVNEVDPYICKR